MDAVIYAAGRALRLGARSAECPKVLLRFGGHSLLERHVRLLADGGVDRVFVVTGHRRERIGNALPGITRRAGIPVIEIYNPEFTDGSVVSFHVSAPVLRTARSSVLVMDGDVLYDQRILSRLIGSAHRSTLLLDRTYSTDDDDPVLVPVRKERPVDFRKCWTGEAEFVGESVGFFKFHPDDIARLLKDARTRAEGNARGDSYDDVIRTLVRAGRVDYEDITGLPWTEVDFVTDIDYGRDTILPQLLPLPAPAFPGAPAAAAMLPTARKLPKRIRRPSTPRPRGAA